MVRALLADDCRLLRRYRPGTRLGAYLHVIAHTRTLGSLRAPLRGVPPERSSVGEDPGEPARLLERADRLREALGQLHPRDAQALRLFHLEGLDYAGIAARLELPAGQVGMVLARARERLRGILGEDFLDSV